MKKIIIGFSRPIKSKILSNLIMWADNSDYSHVYIKWKWESIDTNLIYQASHLSVNFQSEGNFLKNNIIIKEYELEISDEINVKIKKWCAETSGLPYGLMQLIGLGYIKFCQKCFNIKLRNPFPSGSLTYVCNEIGSEVYERSIETDLDIDEDSISPKDLDLLLTEQNVKITYTYDGKINV